MISSLKLQNFQSWSECKLNFHPGVNVIVGPSDKGKSSIFRGMYWNTFNRPTGNSFRSNFTKKNTVASLELDGQFIHREKGSKLNIYNIDNEGDNFQALRSDVPDEIKNIVKMEKINFQPQNENFFLLNETPGKVAKKFNEIAGLEIMDRSLASINSTLRESKQELKSADSTIQNLTQKIEDLKWLDSCNEQYTKIEKQESSLQSSKQKLDIIDNLIFKYDSIFFESYKLPDADALPSIKKILSLDDAIIKIEDKVDYLEKLAVRHSKTEEEIDSLKVLDKAKLTSVSEYRNDMETMNKQVDKIDDIFSSFEKISIEIDQAKSLMDLTKENLFKFKQTNPYCPVCQKPWEN